jgi:hypothetical protein
MGGGILGDGGGASVDMAVLLRNDFTSTGNGMHCLD